MHLNVTLCYQSLMKSVIHLCPNSRGKIWQKFRVSYVWMYLGGWKGKVQPEQRPGWGEGRCKIDDVWGVVRIKLLGVGSDRQEN